MKGMNIMECKHGISMNEICAKCATVSIDTMINLCRVIMVSMIVQKEIMEDNLKYEETQELLDQN
jgi:hypothetical protein